MTKLFAMRRLRPFRKADEGQVLVLTALALLVLMLIASLGLDVGSLRNQKQQTQKAADVGAFAGAPELVYGTPVLAVATAYSHPPRSGPFINNIEYAEVIVSRAQPIVTGSQVDIGVLGGVREGIGNISPPKGVLR